MSRSRLATAILLVVAACLAVFALVSGTSPAAATRTNDPHGLLPSGPDFLQATANALADTGVPARDLASLTQRLKLRGLGNVPATLNSRPPNYPAGARHQFYVADMVKRNYFTVNATIRYVTPHAYWYVRDGLTVNQQYLQASADLFERKIYPTDRRVFGPEVTPGIDNDQHLTVLLASIPGVGGYFSAADAFPKLVNPFSNQRDMIYMATLPTAKTGDAGNYFEGTLAHEFQHMIEWNVHRNRDVWLDEGCSEIAMFVNGYNPGGVDFAFSLNPDVQLNAWDEPNSTVPHYGASYLFLRYLMDRYGGEGFITNLLRQTAPGTQGIDANLRQAGNPAGFDGAFQDWTIANVLNDPSIQGGRYSYTQGGRVQPDRVITAYPATRSDTVHQYAAKYISMQGNAGPLTVSFQGGSAVPVIAAEAHSGRAFWYANRQDSGDATLTRELDLTHTSHATLQFAAWYDIERLFDFAYVEASTDGGKSWVVLKGRYSTTDNSNGTSFGAGWTGKSGAAAGADGTPRWVDESVDLTPYAGKRALVRFEYVTDEGYNRPGFAVDDIAVPEIGYSDSAESDNGWNAAGFVRIGAHMPQRWAVTLLERGSPNRVRTMQVDANGSGTIDLASLGVGSPTREAVLVVSPLAPKTTETASFTVTVRPKP